MARTKIIRTDFRNDKLWEKLCLVLLKPENEFGFFAELEFVNDLTYDGLESRNILARLSSEYKEEFEVVFLADDICFDQEEFLIKALDLKDFLVDGAPSSFRVIPSEMWSVENNMSLANMDFEDFLNNCDENGVFRGF